MNFSNIVSKHVLFLQISHYNFPILRWGQAEPAHFKIGWPMLKLVAKVRILSWTSANLENGVIQRLAPIFLFTEII